MFDFGVSSSDYSNVIEYAIEFFQASKSLEIFRLHQNKRLYCYGTQKPLDNFAKLRKEDFYGNDRVKEFQLGNIALRLDQTLDFNF